MIADAQQTCEIRRTAADELCIQEATPCGCWLTDTNESFFIVENWFPSVGIHVEIPSRLET